MKKKSDFSNSALKRMLLASALLLPLAGFSAGGALAQSFDTTTLQSSASTSQDTGQVPANGGQAFASNGAQGDVNRTSYRTGESPGFAGMSGNKSGVTTKQLGGLTNHLALPYAGTALQAPIFGMGQQYSAPQRFTTVLDDPINLPGMSIDPTSGTVFTRTGNTVTSVGGIGSGSINGGITVGGTSVNLNGIGSGILNGGFSGF
jgi:hypothetical protein